MDTMKHTQAQALLRSGETLSAQAGADLQRHLAGCAACREYAAFIARLEAALPETVSARHLSDAELHQKSAAIQAGLRARQPARRVFAGGRALVWPALTILLAVALGVAIYLARSPGAMPAAPPQAAQGLLVIGDESGYPPGCGPREVAGLVLQFIDAANAGDQARLTEIFPETFEWYSDSLTGRAEGQTDLHFLTSRRDELLPYLAERHARADQLELLAISVIPGWHGGSDFSLVFRRLAADLHLGADGLPRLGSGKGAVNCARARYSFGG